MSLGVLSKGISDKGVCVQVVYVQRYGVIVMSDHMSYRVIEQFQTVLKSSHLRKTSNPE